MHTPTSKAIISIVTILPLLLNLPTPTNADEISGRVGLDDGDTITIQLRLFGIDTPEKKQLCAKADGTCYPCGQQATNFVAGLLGYKPNSARRSKNSLKCGLVPGETSYGRPVAICYLGNINLNLAIVRAGWAIAYKRYLDKVPSLKSDFLKAEYEARYAKRGIWDGAFTMPERWRRGDRLTCE